MTRALVLGGGGVAGIGWETGVLLGLADAGVDLTDADLFVGTSAGSVVAAQVATGVGLGELYERQLLPVEQSGERAADFDGDAFITRVVELLAGGPDREALCRRLGALALASDTAAESVRRDVIVARLPVHDWPERALVVTADDASTAAFGANPLDPETCGPSACAGRAQASVVAALVAEVWA